MEYIIERDIMHDLLKWKEKKTGKLLLLNGARQVGKTFILDSFARTNYDRYIYINCAEGTGRRFEEKLQEAEKIADRGAGENIYKDAMLNYDKSFTDDDNTIVVMDEIQESSYIFNFLRPFARQFNCSFVVTGSYLGRLMDPDYFLPAGDYDQLTMYTVTFPEFLSVFGLRDKYEQLDLFGASEHEMYDEIKSYFDIYLRIGGYPAVVTKYKETQDIKECEQIKIDLIDVFISESQRYFTNIVDIDGIEKSLEGIALLRFSEKDGISKLTDELSKIIYKQASNKITKDMIIKVIAWLKQSNVIGYCSKAIDADFKNVISSCRYYYMDVGIADYFFRETNIAPKLWKGIIAENFVYLSILRNQTKVGRKVFFATDSKTKGELDFVLNGEIPDTGDYIKYGIEVKSTDDSAKTVNAMLNQRKIDIAYLLKGSTKGGIYDKKFTVPLYLADRLDFTKIPEKYE